MEQKFPSKKLFVKKGPEIQENGLPFARGNYQEFKQVFLV